MPGNTHVCKRRQVRPSPDIWVLSTSPPGIHVASRHLGPCFLLLLAAAVRGAGRVRSRCSYHPPTTPQGEGAAMVGNALLSPGDQAAATAAPSQAWSPTNSSYK